MSINYDELEDWALRTLQTLQDFCDDAQEAAGNPDGEDQLPDVRALMLEYEQIAAGQPEEDYLEMPGYIRRGND